MCGRVYGLGDVTYVQLESPQIALRLFSAARLPKSESLHHLPFRTRCRPRQEMADLLQTGNRFLRHFGGLLRWRRKLWDKACARGGERKRRGKVHLPLSVCIQSLSKTLFLGCVSTTPHQEFRMCDHATYGKLFEVCSLYLSSTLSSLAWTPLNPSGRS